MRGRGITSCLIVAMVIITGAGCLGSKTPNIGIDVTWKGIKGSIPFVSNDMGPKDKRIIEVVIVNKDRLYLDGITLRVYSSIPNFKVTPDHASVMPLGPEGTSKTKPTTFTLETLNTPPGRYSFVIAAEYNKQTIKMEEVDVDIG